MLTFTIYGRLECPLCDELQTVVEQHPQYGRAFTLDVLNIDTDPDLTSRYAFRVPVLSCEDRGLSAAQVSPDISLKIDEIVAAAKESEEKP